MPLKAMTFNIRNPGDRGPHAWSHRRFRVVEILRQEAADIVGTQEGHDWQNEELVDALPQYERVGVSREDGELEGEQCAILYDRSRFRFVDSGTFWLSETPTVPGSRSWGSACTRICTWVQLAHAQGHLTVFNCHLDHVSEEARTKGIELIISRFPAGEPALLMGDFNCGEDEEPVLRALEHGLVDTFREIRPSAREVNTFMDFDPTRRVGTKIDFILRTPHLQTKGAAIVHTTFGGAPASDHFPVTATFL